MLLDYRKPPATSLLETDEIRNLLKTVRQICADRSLADSSLEPSSVPPNFFTLLPFSLLFLGIPTLASHFFFLIVLRCYSCIWFYNCIVVCVYDLANNHNLPCKHSECISIQFPEPVNLHVCLIYSGASVRLFDS